MHVEYLSSKWHGLMKNCKYPLALAIRLSCKDIPENPWVCCGSFPTGKDIYEIPFHVADVEYISRNFSLTRYEGKAICCGYVDLYVRPVQHSKKILQVRRNTHTLVARTNTWHINNFYYVPSKHFNIDQCSCFLLEHVSLSTRRGVVAQPTRRGWNIAILSQLTLQILVELRSSSCHG